MVINNNYFFKFLCSVLEKKLLLVFEIFLFYHLFL